MTILIVIALLAALAGFFFVLVGDQAMVTWSLGIAVLTAMLARIAQARAQHDELVKVLEKKPQNATVTVDN